MLVAIQMSSVVRCYMFVETAVESYCHCRSKTVEDFGRWDWNHNMAAEGPVKQD